VREPWADRCPWCHSTYPFAQRIARASGPRAVGHGLEQFYRGEPGTDLLALDEQVTTGISCESCHLGGRAHAEGAPIQFLPRGAELRADAPALPSTFAQQRVDVTVVNAVCGQCHSGPSPRLADRTALRNSSEALDLAASPCVGIKCTDCHDPHRADGRPDEASASAVCVRCHEPQRASVHAGAGHGSTSCLDCHMPRVVMGIDRYVRTHRISSPTDPRLVADAAPNACNLCHLDRSIDWTLAELRAGWDVRITPSRDAYGADDASVGDVWLASRSPAVRLVAAHAYARSPLGLFARRQLERGLQDPLAYVRAWTKLALDELAARSTGAR
jgi:predicted CXXCH cytochrome family protein